MDLFEAIYSLRTMRYLKPDPVPDDLLLKVLEAATQATSGQNLQPWRFVVVREPARKAEIAALYRRALADFPTKAPPRPAALAPPNTAEAARTRALMGAGVRHLAEHLAEAPVLILVCCVDPEHTPAALRAVSHYASIFPAIQNLMLAARGYGLGTTLTTLHKLYDAELKELLGIPPEAETICLIPLGYPARRFGPLSRRPVGEVVYFEGWKDAAASLRHEAGQDAGRLRSEVGHR